MNQPANRLFTWGGFRWCERRMGGGGGGGGGGVDEEEGEVST